MAAGTEDILLYVLLIVVAAKLGGEVAQRLRQPPVVGELLMGLLLGPSVLRLLPSFDVLDSLQAYVGGQGPAPSGHDVGLGQDLAVLALLAELGVLLLLFEIGLESDWKEFRRVGPSAALVGGLGVGLSVLIGWSVSMGFETRIEWVLTDTARSSPHLLHVFVGAVLAATSVGITARVLSDLGKVRTREAQVILGAAVIDDVLGLIVLAIVAALVLDPSGLDAFGLGRIILLALGFFVASILVGRWIGPRLLDWVDRNVRITFAHIGFGFAFMLLFSYLAAAVGLAAIVGAFAGGLALSGSRHRHVLFEHLRPVGSLFIGFFFVTLGARVDLTQVPDGFWPLVLIAALALSLAGIFGKLLSGLGVLGIRADRYVVGVGMVPRGEVGLIFALFGLQHGLIENWQYTTIILVVLVTTLITPFWLRALGGRFHEPSPPPDVSTTAVGKALSP